MIIALTSSLKVHVCLGRFLNLHHGKQLDFVAVGPVGMWVMLVSSASSKRLCEGGDSFTVPRFAWLRHFHGPLLFVVLTDRKKVRKKVKRIRGRKPLKINEITSLSATYSYHGLFTRHL